MTEQSLIERLKLVIMREVFAQSDAELSDSEIDAKYERVARAAIAAMRNLPRHLALAGNAIPLERYGWTHNGTCKPTEEFFATGNEVCDIWKTVIDSALAEGQTDEKAR